MKTILALDGGGIHGLFTLEILDRLESLLRTELRRGQDFRLCEYFNMVAGTSTGAIIASLLAWGMPVEEIRRLYLDNARTMFRKSGWLRRWRAKFTDDAIGSFLRAMFSEADGSPALLGSERLRTLLLVVLKNGTSGSPWPLTNNPGSKFNDRSNPAHPSNLDLPLWQIVRASTAAPIFFPAQRISIEGRDFEFIDGGMTPFNNPSHLAYVMATTPEYRIDFPKGERELLLVSVGTGQRELHYGEGQIHDMFFPSHVKAIISTLMAGGVVHQDLLCRVYGACRFGAPIDSEVGDLVQNTSGRPKAFAYVRYDYRYPDKEIKPLLRQLRCDWQLDSLKLMPFIEAKGAAYAKTAVRLEHFAGFLGHLRQTKP